VVQWLACPASNEATNPDAVIGVRSHFPVAAQPALGALKAIADVVANEKCRL